MNLIKITIELITGVVKLVFTVTIITIKTIIFGSNIQRLFVAIGILILMGLLEKLN